MAENTKNFPSELVSIPSNGWYYDPKSPLATGAVDLKFPTAREEDILTSQNLIMKGVVLDRFVAALLVNPAVQQEDLLLGDWNALLLASRIMGYGKIYNATINCPACQQSSEQEINLEELKDKEIEFLPEQKGKNEFFFTLPASGQVITFKLLTRKDVRIAEKELEGLQKMAKNGATKMITTRMRHSILSIDGISERKELTDAIENMPARDAMAWREYAQQINPDVDLTFAFECPKCGNSIDRMAVPMDVSFFWPNSKV